MSHSDPRSPAAVPTRAQAAISQTDEQLALAFQMGDQAAMAVLVRRHTALAYSLAAPYRTFRSDSDDMRQEALIAVVGAARTFRVNGGASFKSLVALAIRRRLWTVIKLDNRASRRAAVMPLSLNRWFTPEGGDGVESTLEGEVADVFAVDPQAALERGVELDTIVGVIQTELTPIEREAVIGFVFNGETYPEVEARIAIFDGARAGRAASSPVKVVDNALTRARRKLRAALDEQAAA